MQKLFTSLYLLFFALAVEAQDSPVTSCLNSLTICGGKTVAETTIKVGKQFIGSPYVPHTIDINPTEQLVVNVREFDCTTYLETVLALSLTWHALGDSKNQLLFEQTFRTYLTRLRYRDGQINGYASRLHYFSDWLRDKERNGILTDVTRELTGSMPVAKPVSYMTASMYRYPHLSDPVVFKQVAQTEASLSQQSFAFLPKKNMRQAESQLQDGDIVMLMAARPGLDMKHVGLAVRQPNGRIHLLHASSDLGEVVVSKIPISDYLLLHKHLSGVRVARLK